MDTVQLRPLQNFMWGAPAELRHVFENLVAENARLAAKVVERNGQLRSLGETRVRVDGLRENLADLLRVRETELDRVRPVIVAALAVLATVEACGECGVCSDRAGTVIDLARGAGL